MMQSTRTIIIPTRMIVWLLLSALSQALEVKLPNRLSKEVIEFAKQNGVEDHSTLWEPSTLYQIAKGMSQNKRSKNSAVKIFHIMADDEDLGHIKSQVALGFYYSLNENDKKARRKALQYFVKAGESGPHQAALYNAGKIYIEMSEWVQGLAYIHAAATMTENEVSYKSEVSDAAKEAFAIVSQQLSRIDLTTRQMADIFMYANLKDFPPSESIALTMWTDAMKLADILDQQMASKKKEKDENFQNNLESCAGVLITLWQDYSTEMSALQAFLLLRQVNALLSQLVALDKDFVPAAAGYAEALAISPYCYENAALEKRHLKVACFDQHIASARKYYEEVGDRVGVKRLLERVRLHDKANLEYHDEL